MQQGEEVLLRDLSKAGPGLVLPLGTVNLISDFHTLRI